MLFLWELKKCHFVLARVTGHLLSDKIFIYFVLIFVVFIVSFQLVSSVGLTALLCDHSNLTPFHSNVLVRHRRRKGFKGSSDGRNTRESNIEMTKQDIS